VEDESSQTELNGFPNALHESIEIFGLSMAALQGRNGGDIITVFVPFNDNRELPFRLHEPILTLEKQGPLEVVSEGPDQKSLA
jgi:hypothetical protein